MKQEFTVQEILSAFSNKKYTLHPLINIFGIRNETIAPNAFDDTVGILYATEDGWELVQYDATTDPGLYWLVNPLNEGGTAILLPGQYKGVYKIGLHKGYKAFEQVGNMSYVRDNDRDKVLDFELMLDIKNIFTANIKSNIHRANDKWKSVQVDKWSAACQVLADPNEFKSLLDIAEDYIKKGNNNLFDYTLFTLKDVNKTISIFA